MSENNNVGINFTVHNIFIQDTSYEAPNTPRIFTKRWLPKMDFDIEMGRALLEGDIYEVFLKVLVKVTVLDSEEEAKKAQPAGQVAFVVEVKQVGIFELSNVANQQDLDYILATNAPNILFPYVREAVANLVTKGGFPQLVLPPMNFDAMYQQHLAQQTAKAEAGAEEVVLQ
jgi:preprotein translocase subunit SecB